MKIQSPLETVPEPSTIWGEGKCDADTRVAQNARGVVKGVVKGVTRASFGRLAPLTPQLKRASARRREEKVFRGVYMIQQVAAVHLGWGLAPSLDTNITYESTLWVPLDLYCEY